MTMSLKSALELIRDVPDFPKPGILFKDISPLLENPIAFKTLIEGLAECVSEFKPQKLAAIESRGFLIGAPLAYRLNCGLVMIRKKGKLPRKTLSATYALEYGSDQIEMHEDAFEKGERVVLIDDVLATGGTLAAAQELCLRGGSQMVGILVLMELGFLKGRQKLKGTPVKSLLNL